MIAMLLAAGRGERLRPLTDSVPKALVDIQGRSLLERHLDALSAAGVSTVVINLGWLGGQIENRIGSGERYGLRVIYSDEGDNVLETGGGIVRALPFLGKSPFLVVNADIVTDMPFPDTDILSPDVDACCMLVPNPAYRDHGDFGVDKGLLTNAPEHTFAGVAVYRPEFFSGRKAERFSIVPMLREAADASRIRGAVHSGYWADVGTPERLAAANARRR
jgi:MurNAc alpha-1-phosphate uridylyltransferase